MESSDSENAALMEHLERTIPPMDVGDAEQLLRESKRIFDQHGVTFFLRQGTCLGAVRDHALIPWDDDLDLGSIIDMHGFTEDAIEPTVESFRKNGCYVEVLREGLYTSVKIFKYRIRIDWQCYRVVKGTIAHYPGVPFPVSLFTELSEVDFIGDTYLVPSPPEDYLRYKYGPDWGTPKQAGYEKDVLDAMPQGSVPGRPGRLKQWLIVNFSAGQTASLLVLDRNDAPVANAKVRIAGLNRSTTNRNGYAKFYLPGSDAYAVTVTVNGSEEVLYEEAMAPGNMYVYRPDATQSEGRYFVLTEE
ncbi:MAG: LicD family protein [Rhodothermia bacterium]